MNARMRNHFAAAAVAAFALAGSLGASAHGGGVSDQGCHEVKTTGEQHCHVERNGEKFKLVVQAAPDCPELAPVEKIVTVERPISAACVELRTAFVIERASWLGSPTAIASDAIDLGCW